MASQILTDSYALIEIWLVDCQPTVDQDVDGVVIECQPRCWWSVDGVSIEGIDRHLTTDAISTHDPYNCHIW